MPAGIPKIPFLVPGDDDASWVDISNALYRLRAFFLTDKINQETTDQACSVMLYLSIEDNTKDQYMYLNCIGGSLIGTNAIYDMMQYVLTDINTVCIGTAAATASFILSGGAIGKRMAFPHARIMMHQPASSFPDDELILFMSDTKLLARKRYEMIQAYAQRTGQKFCTILEDINREGFMSAEEAKTYGIIDHVLNGGPDQPRIIGSAEDVFTDEDLLNYGNGNGNSVDGFNVDGFNIDGFDN